MKINEENVLMEMKRILSLMNSAYVASNSVNCDRDLNKAIGKLDTLIKILSKAEDG